jgi:N-dimethylarginine dimethylaminohydrolase
MPDLKLKLIRGLIRPTKLKVISDKEHEKEAEELDSPDEMPTTPTSLHFPCYLMNLPLSVDTNQPNNIWMKALPPSERKIDHRRAVTQWTVLYRKLCAEGVVWLLPSNMQLPDQTYVANVAAVLPHLEDPTVVIANFKSDPRKGEDVIGWRFFKESGYRCFRPKDYWEGEAELKFLHDNVYAGGHGVRTSEKSYDWMEKLFKMKVIKCKMEDEYLYHFDCLCFPVSPKRTILCTSLIEKASLKALEKETEIIGVSYKLAKSGITNLVRVNNCLLVASNIKSLKPKDEDYEVEREKISKLEKIAAEEQCEVSPVNLSEFEKSGASLSCLVCHLNFASRYIPLK